MIDAELGGDAGAVTVIGHVLDLPVRDRTVDGADDGPVVDADYWRERRRVHADWVVRFRLNFPHGAVSQALVGSETFLGYMVELRAKYGEVFAHFGDSDVVSLTNPRGGNTRSVFERLTEEIQRSREGEERSRLVRLGGAISYSPVDIDGKDHVGGPSVEAKLTVLLAQAHELWSAVLAHGRYPMAYLHRAQHGGEHPLSRSGASGRW